ncbi:MAG: leucine-rich repeat domain-containing protein [Rikenellaceae bacterium]|nr:leucine-rich repeat domain-containing protein [Rikenellaceae bacterium]
MDSIGQSAFYNCKLVSEFVLPLHLQVIGDNAFYGCGDINIYVPSSVNSFESGNYLFHSCSGSLTINCDISSKMLKHSNFSRIIIGDEVKSIEEDTFNNFADLEYLHIGKGIESLENQSFSGCSNIACVDISDLSKWFEMDHYYGLNYRINRNEVNFTINDTPILLEGDIILPDGISKIGNQAFYGNSRITNVHIPNSAKSIGEYAFYDCNELTNANIPDSVTSIGKCAFSSNSLENATIGTGCIYIDYGAFENCSNLKSIYCKPTIPPAVYYDYYKASYNVTVRAFPPSAKIYVPRHSLSYYMQYSSSIYGEAAQTNWSKYVSQIEPYDFE